MALVCLGLLKEDGDSCREMDWSYAVLPAGLDGGVVEDLWCLFLTRGVLFFFTGEGLGEDSFCEGDETNFSGVVSGVVSCSEDEAEEANIANFPTRSLKDSCLCWGLGVEGPATGDGSEDDESPGDLPGESEDPSEVVSGSTGSGTACTGTTGITGITAGSTGTRAATGGGGGAKMTGPGSATGTSVGNGVIHGSQMISGLDCEKLTWAGFLLGVSFCTLVLGAGGGFAFWITPLVLMSDLFLLSGCLEGDLVGATW